MQPLPNPHVSPLHSFASRTDGAFPTTRRAPPLAETVAAVWRWVSGHRPRRTMRERMLEEKLVERLAEELADEERD